MEKNPYLKLSSKEVLASYSHIELTEDELNEAVLWGKQRKERLLKEQEIERIASENRRLLTSSKWSFDQTKGFMGYRASKLFENQFVIDDNNQVIFNLLCYYFSEDKMFVPAAEEIGVKNPSLEKGIMLAGNFGVGKTWMMKLFMKNQRQVYFMRSAKDIANGFQTGGEEFLEQYLKLFENAANDKDTFFQKYSGVCIDDIGTEDIKSHYGNKKNVIGDIIEQRYFSNLLGPYLHATTNLTATQLDSFYGGRVVSRLREKVNFISLNGNDRRK